MESKNLKISKFIYESFEYRKIYRDVQEVMSSMMTKVGQSPKNSSKSQNWLIEKVGSNLKFKIKRV